MTTRGNTVGNRHPCGHCNGSGRLQGVGPCPSCRATGVRPTLKIAVKRDIKAFADRHGKLDKEDILDLADRISSTLHRIGYK